MSNYYIIGCNAVLDTKSLQIASSSIYIIKV